MFEVDDEVRVKETGVFGVVVDIDDDIVFIELRNGTEMEFRAGQLVLDSEYESEYDRAARLRREESETEIQIVEELCAGAIKNIPEGLIAVAKHNYNVITSMFGQIYTWDELTAYQKMNHVSVTTGVAIDKWIVAGITGEDIAKLSLVAYSNIGRAVVAAGR